MLILDHRYFLGTLRDFSGGGNDGTPTGGAWAGGVKGGFYLDGNDSVDITGITSLIDTTVAVWVQTRSPNAYIFDSESGRFLIRATAGKFRFYDGVAYRVPTIDNNIDDGILHNLAVTGDAAGNYAMYVDSVCVGSGAGNPTNLGGVTKIGKAYAGTNFVTGTIVGCRAWNEVLFPEQVSYEFAQSKRWISPTRTKKHFVFPSRITGRERGLIAGYDVKAEAGQVIDKGPLGYHGTILGPVDRRSEVTGRKILRFNGTSDYVDLGNITELDGVDTFSLSVWATPRGGGGSIFSKTRAPTNSKYRIVLGQAIPGNVACVIANGANTSGLVAGPAADLLHHYVVVYDGTQVDNAGKLKLWINNVQQTLAFTGTIPATTATTHDTAIGRANAGVPTYLDGEVEEVRLYNRPLPPEEIEALYLEGARIVTFQDDLSDATITLGAAESGAGKRLSGTQWIISTGSWKLSDRVGGLPGEKEIENTVAGILWQNSPQAYGTWELDYYKESDSALTRMLLVADVIGPENAAGQDGYGLTVDENERLHLRRYTAGVPADLFYTDMAYVALQTWYKFRVTRSAIGEFHVYIKGGAYTNWTLVVEAWGNNPVTDNTHKTSRYICLDFDAGDRFIPAVHMHGVVAP